ncbi:MAG: hypothetical protein NVS4B3_11660 [Gemmatimonadaceae bacterium]
MPTPAGEGGRSAKGQRPVAVAGAHPDKKNSRRAARPAGKMECFVPCAAKIAPLNGARERAAEMGIERRQRPVNYRIARERDDEQGRVERSERLGTSVGKLERHGGTLVAARNRRSGL